MKKQTIILRDDGMRARILDHISRLNLEKPWEITIGRYRDKRTLSQNSLMWKWIEEVVQGLHDDTGQDKEDIHQHLMELFLMPKITEINGKISRRWSTKGLEKAEMSQYMDKIYAWATTEMGMMLPLPEELGRAA